MDTVWTMIQNMRADMDTAITKVYVVDSKTGQQVKACATVSGARRVVERMNQEYGAYRYTVNGIA